MCYKKNIAPIRILHVVAAMNRAGTETLLMNLYRHIDREKIQFDFAVCTTEKCDYEEEIVSLGGQIIRYPRYQGYNHLSYVAWWKNFLEEHKEYRIIHGHIGSTASIYLRIAKKKGLYTIAHSHNFGVTLNARTALYRVYSYSTRYIADYFFGCSKEAIRDRYGKTIAEEGTRAEVLNNAIDSVAFSFDSEVRKTKRAELEIPEDMFVLGSVGRITQQKNPYGIIEIINEYRKYNEDFLMLWIGVGDLEQEIKREIKKRGLEKHIRMLGIRDDVNELMQAMDVFIFPSLYEGLGIVAIEAQAAGLPTLCSDRLPAEVNITELCRFIPPENITEWVNAIITADTGNRKDMSEEIKAASYDIHDVAKGLEAFYILHSQQSIFGENEQYN